jgi:hypothetical protein
MKSFEILGDLLLDSPNYKIKQNKIKNYNPLTNSILKRLLSTSPVASKFYVGRRFINVTGRSALCLLTSVFISTIFFTVGIPIANQ